MANSANFKYVAGLEQLTAALNALSDDMRKRTLAMGVKAAIQPIKVAAKRFAKRSEETGALRESISDKVVNYPDNGKCVGMVGPDKAYYLNGKKTGKLGKLFANRRPANYAHLVEFGHMAVAPKAGTTRRKKNATEVRFVQPKPFIRPAVMTTTSEQGAAFFTGIEKGFNESLRKIGAA